MQIQNVFCGATRIIEQSDGILNSIIYLVSLLNLQCFCLRLVHCCNTKVFVVLGINLIWYVYKYYYIYTRLKVKFYIQRDLLKVLIVYIYKIVHWNILGAYIACVFKSDFK